MRKLKYLLAIFGILFTLNATPVSAFSLSSTPIMYMGAKCTDGFGGFLGFKTWDACLEHGPTGAPQINSFADTWLIVLPLLEDAIKAAGYVAAGFIIWGGIKYIKSQGDPAELTAARVTIYNAIFGLILVMLSVAIVNFVAGAL